MISQENNDPLEAKKELLMEIPQANVQIYPHYILICSVQSEATSTSLNQEIKSHELVEEKRSKRILMFNNPDLAFHIQPQQKKVQIHNIVKNVIQFEFCVKSMLSLMTIQSLLRKKMCELGFEKIYKVVKELGKGASAQVHLVQRISDKKLFAAKMISIKKANEQNYEIFINQVKLLRLIKHPNVINLESLYIHKKQLIEVLQFLEGGTLLDLLKNIGVKKQERWKILKDVGNGLEHLRKKRIVHRDLKLENILIRINKNGTRDFVISDFGLASWDYNKAARFERCGTPGYIAPEVLNSAQGKVILDHRSDIFSLGVIAHILFVQRPLFAYNGNVNHLLRLNKNAKYDLDSKDYRYLSSKESEFLKLTLQKKQTDRPIAQQLLTFFLSQAEDKFNRGKEKSESKQKERLSKQKKKIEKQSTNVATFFKKRNISLQVQTKNRKEEKKEMSAKKILSGIWQKISTPTSKNVKLKIKENSVQKQRKMHQFID